MKIISKGQLGLVALSDNTRVSKLIGIINYGFKNN